MKHLLYYRVVFVDKVNNPSGSIGIRRRVVKTFDTKEQAELAKDALTPLGGTYEIQERKISQSLLEP